MVIAEDEIVDRFQLKSVIVPVKIRTHDHQSRCSGRLECTASKLAWRCSAMRQIIGLNRENINSLLNGDVFTLSKGIRFEITEESDIVLLFAETDE